MACRFERQGNKGTVHFSGDLTLETLGEMKEAVQKALKNAHQVTLSISDIGSIDVAFLQMICSAHQTAEKMKKEITLSDEVATLYYEFLKESGFLRNGGCRNKKNGACFFRPGDQR